MRLYIGQDYAGNIFISDDENMMPHGDMPTGYAKVNLPFDERFLQTDDPTLTIETEDISEIWSIERKEGV